MWTIKVIHKNGLFIRRNTEGLFIFNSYVGLVYAIHKDSADEVLEWLDSTDNPEFAYQKQIDSNIKDVLSAGWLCDVDLSNHNICTLLPNRESWGKLKFPKRPLMINWLITGKCNFSCSYCYAQDLMHNNVVEPTSLRQVEQIANNILKLNPLVVVLTGGEPTTSPYLKDIIKYLHNKVGIILDTNGSFLNKNLADFLKSYDVVVRLSIDSFNKNIQNEQRIIIDNKKSIINVELALDNCLKSKTVVTIQTVVTKNNINTLENMFDDIYKKGVKSWRLLKIQTSKFNQKNYIKLVSEQPVYNNIFKKLISLHQTSFKKKIKLQISENYDSDANSVILVSTEGNFYTEVPHKQKKDKIDFNNLEKQINYDAHYRRYLNILWEDF